MKTPECREVPNDLKDRATVRKTDDSNDQTTVGVSELVGLLDEATNRLCSLLVRHGVRLAIWTAENTPLRIRERPSAEFRQGPQSDLETC